MYRYSDAWELDPSPFCAKVQAYLGLAEIPHVSRASVMHLLKAPRRKLAYINDDGHIVTDSGNIIEHLRAKQGDVLDDWLTPEQKATGHLVNRMLEDGTYWIGVYYRWRDDTAWTQYEGVLFSGAPKLLQPLIARTARRDYRRRLDEQGLGRRPKVEVDALAKQDVSAISGVLARKSYLLGERSTSFDATVFGFIGNAHFAPNPGPLKECISEHQNLVAYLGRIRQRVGFPSLHETKAFAR